MNLAALSGLGAGEAGQGRESIDLRGLESATSDGGRSGKSSPPEGPGETAVGEEKELLARREKGGRRGEEKNWRADVPLEHYDGV